MPTCPRYVSQRGASTRTLVVSDIHGNWPALQAVIDSTLASVDTVIALGDLVGYGPFPAECVRWVSENASIAIQGNHDRAYGANVAAGCRPDFRWLSDAVGPLTWSQLNDEQLAYLKNLPRWAVREIDGRKFAFVHAAPSDPLYEYIGPDPGRWAVELSGLEVDVLVVGHTHLQFSLRVAHSEVVNPGSVGQPKDGDPRAAFLLIEDGVCKLERVEYPIDEAVAALGSHDIDPDAVAVLADLLFTGSVPRAAAESNHATSYGPKEEAPPHWK
ncbi:MAG: YfcE family phosphodiesterase [Gemmatimonadaceae bacterium]